MVTAYVYDDAKWEETLEIVDETSPYALTGAVFAQRPRGGARGDRSALRNAAGNFYINDKPTGAVVGQQPFGGARGIGHERQGGLEAEPGALGERADDQGDVLAAARLQLSVHGGGVETDENPGRTSDRRERAPGIAHPRAPRPKLLAARAGHCL